MTFNSSVADCKSPFDVVQTNTIKGVTLTGASLSTVGSLFIVFSYFWFPRLRTFPYKLIMYLSVADFFSSIAYFVGIAGEEPANTCNSASGCYISAVMTQYFDVCTFVWTAIIGHTIYLIFVKKVGRAVENYERKYHLIGWGLPMIFAIIVAIADGYGDAGNWCWISVNKPLLRFFCYYLPLLIVIVYNSINYMLVGWAVRDHSQESSVNRRLRLYLVVFIFVRIWGVIDRVHDFLSPSPIWGIVFLHSVFSPLQGFANSLVYGCNRQVASQYKRCMTSASDDGAGATTEQFDQEMSAISLQ